MMVFVTERMETGLYCATFDDGISAKFAFGLSFKEALANLFKGLKDSNIGLWQ